MTVSAQPDAGDPAIFPATEGNVSRLGRFIRTIIGLPARILLLSIRLYQVTLSPALPVIFGSACGCRFSPTCSHYAADAIRTHGAIVGAALSLVRLVKCTPLHPGGDDPVPDRVHWTTGPRDYRTPARPFCVSAINNQPSSGRPVVLSSRSPVVPSSVVP